MPLFQAGFGVLYDDCLRFRPLRFDVLPMDSVNRHTQAQSRTVRRQRVWIDQDEMRIRSRPGYRVYFTE